MFDHQNHLLLVLTGWRFGCLDAGCVITFDEQPSLFGTQTGMRALRHDMDEEAHVCGGAGAATCSTSTRPEQRRGRADAAAASPAATALTTAAQNAKPSERNTQSACETSYQRSTVDTAGGTSSPTAKTRRGRTPTYALRKQEKVFLLKEIEKLQALLAKQRAEAKRSAQDRQSVLQQKVGAGFLRDAVQEQQMAVVGVQSALSGIVCKQHYAPRQVNICLGTNLEARQATLVKVKARTLQLVHQHLAERGRFVSPTSAFADISRFRSPEGDYCALIYDVVPFEGIKTVKEVYDALKCYYHNMEIRVTEALGDVTIREDDGSSGPGISQCRVVSYLSNGAQLEMNAVICSHYEDVDLEYGEGRATGVFSEDFVDQDDLYPYLPNERVRQDVTVVLRIKSYLRKRVNRDGTEEDELVVVLTRWGHVKIHKTDITLPTPVVHEIREGIAQWGDVMLQAVRELVYHPGRPLDLEAMTRKKSPTRVDI